MTPIDGTLYGPALPPAGQPARAWFVAGRLRVEAPPGGVALAKPFADAAAPPRTLDVGPELLQLHPGGHGHDALFLRWVTPDTHAHWAFAPTGPEAVQRLLATLPPALAPLARRWRRRVATGRRPWLGLGGCLGALVLAGLGLWWGFGQLLDGAARRVPPALERSLGQATVDDLERHGRLVTTGPMVATVAVIGQRLVPPGSPYTYRWYVAKDSSVNAFAAPGGYVVVHTGLIEKARSPDELAGVLAHEIQHVERRHVTKGLLQAAGWGTLVLVTLGDTSGLAAVLAQRLGTLTYARGLEAEADAEGVRDLARAGIPPDALRAFFGRLLADERRAGAGVPEWLSSHPATPTRMATLARLAATTPCHPACVSLAADPRIPWAAAQAEATRLDRDAPGNEATRPRPSTVPAPTRVPAPAPRR